MVDPECVNSVIEKVVVSIWKEGNGKWKSVIPRFL